MNFLQKNPSDQALLTLRFGLGLVFLWFGIDHIVNHEIRDMWVPQWAVFSVFTPVVYTAIFGIADIVLGLLLLLGKWMKVASLLLIVQMLFIVVVVAGYNATGVRDFAILVALLALYFLAKK